MVESTCRSKMRSTLVSCLFSIVLVSSLYYDATRSGFPFVFAETAVRTVAARKSVRGEDNSIKTCPASGTLSNDLHYVLDEHGDLSDASCKSLSLCLRPLTARSGVYLRTLSHFRRGDNEKDIKDELIDFCWQSSPATEKVLANPMPSKQTLKVAAISSRPPTVRLTRENNERKQSLGLKLDLLFATKKVQNNEISLPPSIEEHYKGRLPPNMELSSRAAARVDLSGRWRPSTQAQDLTDYDQFLKACCSDKISYWTRQLLSSSSVVSRQEFIVKQLDGGRLLELVDIHPLASIVWNRTVITNTAPDQSFVNQLEGPQEDQVLIEAYWEENGTVHTSSLRMVENDATSGDNEGWLRTRLYLFPTRLETREDETRTLVVETTYHSTLYPTDTEAMLKAGQGDDASTTKMVWKWEEVIGSSR